MRLSDNLDKLNEVIEKTRTHIAEKKEERRKKKRKEKEEKKKFWKEEQKYLDEKKRLAEEIFEWCEEFSKSEYFRRLVEIDDASEVFVHLSGYEPNSLTIYESGWGHKRYHSRHRHSHLSLRKDGTLVYRLSISGVGGRKLGEKMKFSNPADLAESLTKDYLEDLHKHVQSGEVYDALKEKLENARL